MYEDEFELTFQVPEEESAPEPLAAPAAKPAAPAEPVVDEPTRIMTLEKTAAPVVEEPTRVITLEKPAEPPAPPQPEEPAPQPRPCDVQQHESQPDRDGKERHDLHRIPDYAAAHEPAAAEGVRFQPPEKRRQHRRDAEIAQHMRALRRAPIQRPLQLADGTLHRAGFVIHLPHSYERARPCLFRPERNHGEVLLCVSCGAIVAQAGAASF